MKKLLIAGLALMSLNVFSQSYLVLQNGVTLTTDKAGFVYDFAQFVLPYRVSVNGGQFLVENEKLLTVDEFGFLYRKDLKVKDVKGTGLNYFINKDGHLFTIDSMGFFYKYDKDGKQLKKATEFGGNFFVVERDKKKKLYDLFTVNSAGNYFNISVEGLNPAEITDFGGNYFVAKGVLYTVSKDGFVFAKPENNVGKIVKKGGNYFITEDGKLYTVADSGFLILPILPANIVVADVEKLGSNYMVDTEGRIFTVDTFGNMYERDVTAHDLRIMKLSSY